MSKPDKYRTLKDTILLGVGSLVGTSVTWIYILERYELVRK